MRSLEATLRNAQRLLQPNLPPRTPGTPLFEELRKWRSEQARAKQMPPYIIATDAALHAIEKARPKDLNELGGIRGVGASKAIQYGAEILQIVAAQPQPA